MDQATDLFTRHRLTSDQFYQMAEAGLFDADTRIELIEGELIDMAPIGADHEGCVNRLVKTLVIQCGDDAIVSPQNSIRLDFRNVPQPDFVLLHYRDDFYTKGARPGPGESILVIEVSDSSIRFDREVKVPIYARAGVPEVWIIDIQQRRVEVYREPRGGDYAMRTLHRLEDSLSPALLPGVVIPIRSILG